VSLLGAETPRSLRIDAGKTIQFVLSRDSLRLSGGILLQSAPLHDIGGRTLLAKF
jgi:hypothetical protein